MGRPSSTITQKTVGTAAVQLTANTAAASQPLNYGVVVTWDTITYDGNIYWGKANTVTTANGMLLVSPGQISASSVVNVGDIWFISDTAAQVICCEIVGQEVTIS